MQSINNQRIHIVMVFGPLQTPKQTLMVTDNYFKYGYESDLINII